MLQISVKPSSLSLSSSSSSLSATETVNGYHDFKITGYSLAKGIGVGKYIASETFMVGGHSWAIYFYPDGKIPDDNRAYVSLFIALASEGTDVRALFELTLFDQSGNERHKVHTHFGRALEDGPYTLRYRGSMWWVNGVECVYVVMDNVCVFGCWFWCTLCVFWFCLMNNTMDCVVLCALRWIVLFWCALRVLWFFLMDNAMGLCWFWCTLCFIVILFDEQFDGLCCFDAHIVCLFDWWTMPLIVFDV